MVVYCRCVEADMLMDPLLYHVTTDAGAADCQVVMTDDADDHSDCSATDLPDQVSFIILTIILPLFHTATVYQTWRARFLLWFSGIELSTR